MRVGGEVGGAPRFPVVMRRGRRTGPVWRGRTRTTSPRPGLLAVPAPVTSTARSVCGWKKRPVEREARS